MVNHACRVGQNGQLFMLGWPERLTIHVGLAKTIYIRFTTVLEAEKSPNIRS